MTDLLGQKIKRGSLVVRHMRNEVDLGLAIVVGVHKMTAKDSMEREERVEILGINQIGISGEWKLSYKSGLTYPSRVVVVEKIPSYAKAIVKTWREELGQA